MPDFAESRKVINYQIQTNANVATLGTNVKAELDLGWVLFGPPFAENANYCQCLVKLKPEPSTRVTA
jgi:hypothetical protein